MYTAEYSIQQKCYHIDSAAKTVERNLEAVHRGKHPGYLVIGIFDSYEEASAFIALHRQYTDLENLSVAYNGRLKH
jgi:hypothetical protein